MLRERLRESWAEPVLRAGREHSILGLDGPAVLAPVRHTKPDERYAFVAIVIALRAANEEGAMTTDAREITGFVSKETLRGGVKLEAWAA